MATIPPQARGRHPGGEERALVFAAPRRRRNFCPGGRPAARRGAVGTEASLCDGRAEASRPRGSTGSKARARYGSREGVATGRERVGPSATVGRLLARTMARRRGRVVIGGLPYAGIRLALCLPTPWRTRRARGRRPKLDDRAHNDRGAAGSATDCSSSSLVRRWGRGGWIGEGHGCGRATECRPASGPGSEAGGSSSLSGGVARRIGVMAVARRRRGESRRRASA